MRLDVVIKSIDYQSKRLFATLKELLGTWEENAQSFKVGQTVTGIIRSVESYGIFVELAPNLAGLAEVRPETGESPERLIGKSAAVYIKSIIPERMKIKLVIIDECKETQLSPRGLHYYIDTNAVKHMEKWQYSPKVSARVIETVFGDGYIF